MLAEKFMCALYANKSGENRFSAAIDSIDNSKKRREFFSYEFASPLNFSLEDSIEKLRECGILELIDGFVCTDSPLARLRHSAIFAALKLQNKLQIPAVATMSMRDRNSLALQSELIGANSLGVRLILALTGDAIRLGNQPQAKGVFEGNSACLLEIICALNNNKDIAGHDIKGNRREIFAFCVMNSYSKNKDTLKNKMRQKITNGARAIFTQPIYDIRVARELLEWRDEICFAACGTNQSGEDSINKKDSIESDGFLDSSLRTCFALNTSQIETGFNEKLDSIESKSADIQNSANSGFCELVFGFFPITSLKTALFLRDKLPGVFVPDEWIERLQGANGDLQKEEQIGFELSLALFCELCALHPKIHIMSANKPELCAKILKNYFAKSQHEQIGEDSINKIDSIESKKG